jgi:hypothetical protein
LAANQLNGQDMQNGGRSLSWIPNSKMHFMNYL